MRPVVDRDRGHLCSPKKKKTYHRIIHTLRIHYMSVNKIRRDCNRSNISWIWYEMNVITESHLPSDGKWTTNWIWNCTEEKMDVELTGLNSSNDLKWEHLLTNSSGSKACPHSNVNVSIQKRTQLFWIRTSLLLLIKYEIMIVEDVAHRNSQLNSRWKYGWS